MVESRVVQEDAVGVQCPLPIGRVGTSTCVVFCLPITLSHPTPQKLLPDQVSPKPGLLPGSLWKNPLCLAVKGSSQEGGRVGVGSEIQTFNLEPQRRGVGRGEPLSHTVYKPNIMSVCVSLEVRV